MQKRKSVLILFMLMFTLSACFTPDESASVPTLTSPPIITPDALTPSDVPALATTPLPTNNAVNSGVSDANSAVNNPTAVITLQAPTLPSIASGSTILTPWVTSAVAANSGTNPVTAPTNDLNLPQLGGAASVTCTPPAGWVAYTVQDGDTVSTLSLAVNVAMADIVAANCLTDADVIQVGQTIYLPTIPVGGAAPQVTAVADTSNVNAGMMGNTGNTTNSDSVVVTLNPGANTNTNAGTTGNTNAIPGSTGSFISVNLWTEPAVVNSGQYHVTTGTTITIRATGITAANAQQVTFMLAPVGSTNTPTVVGIDNNLADGVSVQWEVVAANLQANVWLVVTSISGTFETIPIIVVTNGVDGQ